MPINDGTATMLERGLERPVNCLKPLICKMVAQMNTGNRKGVASSAITPISGIRAKCGRQIIKGAKIRAGVAPYMTAPAA